MDIFKIKSSQWKDYQKLWRSGFLYFGRQEEEVLADLRTS